MSKLTRNLYVPFIDITKGAEKGTYDWKPIDLSSVFELAYNPNTETYSYICYANDSNEIINYAPTMEQEIVLDSENEIYKFMLDFMRSMPTGSDANVPIMIAYPDSDTAKTTEADVWDDAVISPGTINTIDGKLTFTLNLNGAVTPGTVAISGGTATFSPAGAEAASYSEVV